MARGKVRWVWKFTLLRGTAIEVLGAFAILFCLGVPVGASKGEAGHEQGHHARLPSGRGGWQSSAWPAGWDVPYFA